MRHLQKEGGVLSSLNQTINLFLPTISGLGAGTFFFYYYYSYHIYLLLRCASSKQVYGGVGKWSSPREKRRRSKEDTWNLSRSGSQTWFHCCIMLLLFQQRGKNQNTKFRGFKLRNNQQVYLLEYPHPRGTIQRDLFPLPYSFHTPHS